MSKLVKIGHRGAAGHEPENTLLSLAKAIELGVDMIEIDVRRCGSGELVVMHDETVDRTTDGKGKVSDLSLKELKSLDAGEGEKIPTLEEAIELVNKRAPVVIELKGRNTARAVASNLQHYIKNGWAKEDFLVISLNWNELVDFVEVNPGVPFGVSVGKNPFAVGLKAKQVRAYSIQVPRQYLNVRKRLIGKLREQGFKVFVYTLNKPESIALAKEVGVDGIFSDYPERI